MSDITARDPRAEAQALLPVGYAARVLEPSPPASTDPEWWADDPTDLEGAADTVVTPIAGEGVTWDEVLGINPHVEYLAQHWLGAFPRLQPLPDGFSETRHSLHQVAFFAVAAKRYAVTQKLGLRYTFRGFGTPFFSDDRQVRVEGGDLVHQRNGEVTSTPLSTVGEACQFLDIPYAEVWFDGFHDPLVPLGPEETLETTDGAVAAVSDWFGFATLVLERTRRTPGAVEVSRVQLWPEHFDAAVELGALELGHRASYGASPGDDAHPEPYLYVAAWGDIDRADPFWNDSSFNGASFAYTDLLKAEDQIATAVDFFGQGYDRLTGEGS